MSIATLPGAVSAAHRHQPLHHVVAGQTGRIAIDRGGDVVPLLLVKAGRPAAKRRQRYPGAAASPALFFCHRQYAAADPRAAQILGEKEPTDIDEPEFGPSVEPADDLAGLRIADEHGEPAKIAVSGLAQIVGAETIGDHRHVAGSSSSVTVMSGSNLASSFG